MLSSYPMPSRDPSVPDLFHYMKASWVLRPVSNLNASYLKVKCETPTHVDKVCRNVLKRVVKGKADRLLQQNRGCVCSNEQDAMGRCIFYFGNLMECSCETLDRKKTDHRDQYEKQILDLVEDMVENNDMKEINFCIFGAGLLFSDFVLFTRMLDVLKTMKWKGNLRLHFIDHNYTHRNPILENNLAIQIQNIDEEIKKVKSERFGYMAGTGTAGAVAIVGACLTVKAKKKVLPAIGTGVAGIIAIACTIKEQECSQRLEALIEQREEINRIKAKRAIDLKELTTSYQRGPDNRSTRAIQDFLNYLVAALPRKMGLKVYFFKDAEEYISVATSNPKFKNDVLIGSDLNSSLTEQERLRQASQRTGGKSVLLNRIPVPHPILDQWEGQRKAASQDLSTNKSKAQHNAAKKTATKADPHRHRRTE
ncbi:MAG: hypothetical protein LLG04_02550 [Parachlamydia sp.]|nr:hypothetical protein [Parachlamydia sp.]